MYFKARQSMHIKSLNEGTHHSIKLQRAWNKYGAENFEWETIEVIQNVVGLEPKEFVNTLLLPRETFYIKYYNAATEDGYNICLIAGSSLGLKRTPEQREKMKVAQQLHWQDVSERLKMSEIVKTRYEDPDYRMRFSLSQQLRWEDEEQRIKMSEVRKSFYVENPDAARQHSEDLITYWSDLTKREEQSERLSQFHIDNPDAGAEQGQRMQAYYEQHPEARDEMRDIKNAYHDTTPQAAEDARERAKLQFSDPAAREAASERALAFYNSPDQIFQRNSRDVIIRSKLLEGMTIREIAADIHVSAQIITPIRQGLVAEGLLSNKVSETTKERMRKPKSEEHRQNISLGQKGHEVSNETRERIRESSHKQFANPEARQVARDNTIAFNNSPEQVAKREQRDAPIRKMLEAGYKQLDIIKALHVSSRTITNVKNSMKTSMTG